MNFSKIFLVIQREFSIRVKKKSFIITTILVPLLFVGLMIIPSLLMMKGDNEEYKILLVDDSGIIADKLQDTDKIKFVLDNGSSNIDYLKNKLDSLGVSAIAHISELSPENHLYMHTYSIKQMNIERSEKISSMVENILRDYKIELYDVEGIEDLMKDINKSVKINSYTIGEDGKENKSVYMINMAISYILGFSIYMFVVMFGQMVLRSVIDEKSNRIIEVIISSVKPFDLMIGKILGVASVALVQFFIWILLAVVFIMSFQMSLGVENVIDQETMSQIASASNSNEMLSNIVSSPEIAEAMSTIAQIDFAYIIGVFVIYFVLGYLLYAAIFAAIGSAVENETDTQQLILPITMPLMLGFFVMMHTFQHPDTELSFWFSIIPFTSPMVMLARIPFDGGVPLWELLLSISILFFTFLFITYISAKIYRIGILSYGKSGSWKDIWKWLKY